MAGLVDHEAVLVEFRSRLPQRASWGLPQLLTLMAELEAKHRIDETADAAVLRRFGDHLTDVVLDLLPSATSGPLTDGDHPTLLAMEAGAASRSSKEDAWPPPLTFPRPQASRSAGSPLSRRRAPAAT